MIVKIRDPQAWALPILITLASLNGLIKALTGVRYAPLLIDAALVGLLLSIFATHLFRNRLKMGGLDILAGVFILTAFLEMFHPNIPSFQAGLEGFRKFAFMIVGFFIGRYIINVTAVKHLIGVLLAGSFFISLYGVKQYILPTALDYRLIELSTASPITYMMGGHIRAFSTLAGPFHLGIYLVCTLLLLSASWFHYPNRRLAAILLGTPMLAALVMTVTKSNWAGLLAGILILVLLNSKRPLRLIWTLFVIGSVTGLILYLLLWVSSVTPGLETVYAGLQALINPLEAPTFKFRLDLWNETVIPLMTRSPWLGYGTGSAGEGLGNLFETTSSIYVVAHNLYFKIQIELGLIGVILFFTFLLNTLFYVWRAGRQLQDPLLKMTNHWMLAFAVAVAVAGLTGAILDAYPVNLIFWLLLGISTRLNRYQNSEDLDMRQGAGDIALVSSEVL